MVSLGLISHIFNEELLLPEFCKFHLPMVDKAIIIDYNSNDHSREIIKEICPEWIIVNSKNKDFDAVLCDEEVMEYEKSLNTDFKIALTVTEFLWNYNFKERLEEYSHIDPNAKAFGGVSFELVSTVAPGDPLWKNHTRGTNKDVGTTRPRWRFAHNSSHGQYTPGRHGTFLPHMFCNDLFLLHYRFAPWPGAYTRKMQIQNRVPKSDLNKGMGLHHIMTPAAIEKEYEFWFANSYDLLQDPGYRLHYDERLKLI